MIFSNDKQVNRLALYFFHDKDGIVDEYVPTFLAELKRFTTFLLVIVNGTLDEEGRRKLETVSDDILVRENKGFDVTAYKAGLEHIGQEKIEKFDEYIFVNSTLFGPIYSFDEMFETMNERDLDFWGITKHHEVDFDCFGTCKYGYIPEHIQSSFLAIRSSLFKTEAYKSFWKVLPHVHSYEESIGFFEAIFTKEFNDIGFVSDVYVQTDDLEGYTRYPLMMMSYELVKNRKCPVIKRKSFSQNYYDILTDTVGNTTVDVFEYIQNNTNYNVDLIFQNIIRTCNMADIKQLMHFNYILPKNYKIPEVNKGSFKVALMMHIYYDDLIDYCFNYAKSMPEYADLIITTTNDVTEKSVREKIKNLKFNNVKVLRIENRGRDVSSLLVGCAPYVNEYDYVCFMHDKKTTQMQPYCNGESFSYKCFENNLASKEFVENILTTFEKNPRLGMLMPPPPNHGSFYQILGQEWASDYGNTLSLAYKLNLKCNIYSDKEPISPLGTMFWFRPKALKTLFDYGWKYEDFPSEPNGFDGTLLHAIERIYGFVVQHEGFYPAWLMTDSFAQIELSNLHFMVRELNGELLKKYPLSNLLDMTQKMKTNMKFIWSHELGFKFLVRKYCPEFIWKFLKKVKRIYIAHFSRS